MSWANCRPDGVSRRPRVRAGQQLRARLASSCAIAVERVDWVTSSRSAAVSHVFEFGDHLE